MNAFPRRPLSRRLGALVGAVLLAGGGIVTTAGSASATVTVLCTGYSGCAKAGYSSSGYSTANGTMYWRMYSGHNCTNYAAYRMVHSGMPNTRPWTGSGNATNWGSAMSRITNGTPAVGAVAWWRAGVYPAGSAGHVAYVEKVVSPTDIIVSMDSWHGDFSWAEITTNSRGWPSGFIHFNDVHLTNTTPPAITGTPKVGTGLTVSHGTWNAAGATYTYQWLANGAVIKNATTSSFTPTTALTGKQLSVRVTASAAGYPTTTALSALTAAVQPGVISNTAPPTTSGEPEVGSTLSAAAGSWNPAPVTLAYQWMAGGAPIADATSSTLAVDPSLVGKALSVKVTATRSGYAAVSKVSAVTAAVKPGTLTQTSAPAVSGTVAPRNTLRVGGFAVAQDATSHLQWFRGTARIPGATGATYAITSADLGHRLRARVRWTAPGYDALVERTSWSRVVRSTPVVHLALHPGANQLAFRLVVRAPGVPHYNGIVQIRGGGKLIKALKVRGGVASGTLTGLKTGTRAYHFRLPMRATTERAVVVRSVHIR